MPDGTKGPSARQTELLEAAYDYVLERGLVDLSLRPLAAAIGSSPRVLLFLFGSKDGLVQALLGRARSDELALLDRLRCERSDADLSGAVSQLWDWLSDPSHLGLLRLWVEGYARSLIDPSGPWAGFARQTVDDWLEALAEFQRSGSRGNDAARAECTRALAVLRGGLLDLLATGENQRVSRAVQTEIERLHRGPSS